VGNRRGLDKGKCAINYRTRFTYRIDMRDAEGEDTTEHLAGIEDLQFAKATYLAACRRWPGHQSPCAKARKSLKTIGYGLCKEHSGDYERPGKDPDHGLRRNSGGDDRAQGDTVKDGPVVLGLRDPRSDGPHDRGGFHGHSHHACPPRHGFYGLRRTLSWLEESDYVLARYRAFLKHARKPSSWSNSSQTRGYWDFCQ
jgi:hypothetical protein